MIQSNYLASKAIAEGFFKEFFVEKFEKNYQSKVK